MHVYKTGYVLSLAEEKRMEGKYPIHKSLLSYKTATLEDIRQSGAPYYKYVSSSSDTCAFCAALDGMAFHVSDAVDGINLPPLHPNCKCDIVPYNFEDELYYNSLNPHDNPGGVTPNDWRFFGWNGDEFNSEPEQIYTDDYFGKAIKAGDYNQADMDMHIVDRIARILFHETSDRKGQEAFLWIILNRMLKDGAQYTTNQSDELTLFNIAASSDQFEVFQEQHNKNPNQPNSYSPIEWISNIENSVIRKEQEDSWKNSLRLAKLLVAVSCNPEMKDTDIIRDVLESWVPNPFDCDTPYDVYEYRAGGHVSSGKTWEETIGGNTFFIW